MVEYIVVDSTLAARFTAGQPELQTSAAALEAAKEPREALGMECELRIPRKDAVD